MALPGERFSVLIRKESHKPSGRTWQGGGSTRLLHVVFHPPRQSGSPTVQCGSRPLPSYPCPPAGTSAPSLTEGQHYVLTGMRRLACLPSVLPPAPPLLDSRGLPRHGRMHTASPPTAKRSCSWEGLHPQKRSLETTCPTVTVAMHKRFHCREVSVGRPAPSSLNSTRKPSEQWLRLWASLSVSTSPSAHTCGHLMENPRPRPPSGRGLRVCFASRESWPVRCTQGVTLEDIDDRVLVGGTPQTHLAVVHATRM